MSKLEKLEYRVREKTVYFVTRYCQYGDGGSVSEEGEFRDPLSAQRAALALCEWERMKIGADADDPRITGPEPIVYSDLSDMVA